MGRLKSQVYALPWLVFTLAAFLEVGGDALVRRGLRGGGVVLIIAGFAVLGCYAVLVNSLKWDFSKLLGVYVGFFALVSILFGRFVFKEVVPWSTWFGLGLIIAGGMVIQFGHR
jgi:drug/metabolite transporter superfamily protein YnfA